MKFRPLGSELFHVDRQTDTITYSRDGRNSRSFQFLWTLL